MGFLGDTIISARREPYVPFRSRPDTRLLLRMLLGIGQIVQGEFTGLYDKAAE